MANHASRLQRQTLRTSRLLDFCSRKELIAQTGHQPDAWPLVVLKELVDNAIDACEDNGAAPEIAVIVDKSGIAVADNGPGILEDTVASVLDFSVRVSSREHYVSPTRGAQGNALKTIVAMPFVLDGEVGKVEIAARGIRHEVVMRVDRIRQQPTIHHQQHQDRLVKNGTHLTVHWPPVCMPTLEQSKERFLQLSAEFTVLNPHLTLSVSWFGERVRTKATNPTWKKWLPSDPTSPHWYTPERFERLAAGYVGDDEDRETDRTVREFVAEFHGLSATAKQKAVLKATGLARVGLSALRNGDGLNHGRTRKLWEALRANSKPIKAKALGLIGRDHLAAHLKAMGCRMESFKYAKVSQDKDADGLPCILETAFAWCPELRERRIITGVNWSPGITNPFRQLGRLGQSLDEILREQRVGWSMPSVFVLHVACPRVEYTDRGKSAVVVGGVAYHGSDQVEE